MALNFQRPNFPVPQYQGIANLGLTLDSIINAYQQAKRMKMQDDLQAQMRGQEQQRYGQQQQAALAQQQFGNIQATGIAGTPEQVAQLQGPVEEMSPLVASTADYLRRKREQGLQLAQAKTGLAEAQASKAAQPQPQKPTQTKGQEALDRAFAKEYNEFIGAGGYADVQKNLGNLQDVIAALEGGRVNATGPGVGLIPKSARDIVMPKGAALQDRVEEVVQRNLRQVLGAQFTEREGMRLIERSYNPRQPEAENADRLKRLMRQIDDAARAKAEAGAYFEENGTLAGFKGKLYRSADDFMGDVKAPAGKTITQRNKKTGQVRVSTDGGKTWKIQ